jgi:hypothetical protein
MLSLVPPTLLNDVMSEQLVIRATYDCVRQFASACLIFFEISVEWPASHPSYIKTLIIVLKEKI